MKIVNLLTRNEMKKITGGDPQTIPACRITLYEKDGSGDINSFLWAPPAGICTAQSSAANSYCVT